MSILHDFDQNEKSKIVKINIGTCMKKIFKQTKNWAEFCEKKTFSNIARRLIYKKKPVLYKSKNKDKYKGR